MKLNERLRRLREAAGLSQKEISRLVGVSDRTWAAYEAGTSAPKAAALDALVCNLRVEGDPVSAMWVLCGRGPMCHPENARSALSPEQEEAVRVANRILEAAGVRYDVDREIDPGLIRIIQAYRRASPDRRAFMTRGAELIAGEDEKGGDKKGPSPPKDDGSFVRSGLHDKQEEECAALVELGSEETTAHGAEGLSRPIQT